ncbi:MAG: cofactor assembly of complex C subunit B [Trichodesmium sp. St16_bin4-tuft]|nr:cofactor assembly of complex C subunit B [Trichodesmium sp. MAG_R01]MDE5071525.1 cofactor assembly of complex C subunit B [Trichodesmium sp. St5_bin8]MDE5078442.1 cofactor assembly of complex C subunit B [Trichodesmium sp. St2_bin6]MDE5091408.1 cofactor assembly of complex C subunit B [Trichodesmium sp. St18_bin3_1_1]MDE5100499.1 cofactor assembly of complex C subunit B [Trichodesmium sp. St16_bin4-tuft]MDE5101585.1 cofactor assembly of complex C subunit B [Trichodesmium sp. St19_bin2]
MNNTALISSFILTFLSSIGLIFFIKASVKPRTKNLKLIAEQEAELLLKQLKEYFSERAYRIIDVNAAKNQLTFEGIVRPSWFLAFFLTLLAALGALCFGLAISMLVPESSKYLLWLVLVSPLAGIFYWQKSKRPEKVELRLEGILTEGSQSKSLLSITGHRDELAALQTALSLKGYQ